MSILDRFKKPAEAAPQHDVEDTKAGEPGCSICGTTRSQVIARIEARGLRAVGFYFGICPVCRKGFCRDHMVRGDKHDFMDFDKCPDDGTRLKVFGPDDQIALEPELMDFPKAAEDTSKALDLAANGDPTAVDALLNNVRDNAGKGGGRQDFVYPCLEALELLVDRAAEQLPVGALAQLTKLHEEKFYSPVFGEELTLPKLLSAEGKKSAARVVECAQRELDRRASP
jgi:hypothetical protein